MGTLVVDAANVVGSRPDGWWRDRVGAAERLLDRLARFASASGERVVVVLEGQATRAGDRAGLDVVRADRDGDSAILGLLAGLRPDDGDGGNDDGDLGTDAAPVVVTSDRELARLAAVLGAQVRGAGRLLAALGEP